MKLVTVAGIVMAGISACSSGDLTPGSSRAITPAIGSDAIEIAQGTVLLVAANVLRNGTYAGDVATAVDATPSGLRARLSDAQTADGITSSVLAVAVDTFFATGIYHLTVRASGTGQPDETTPLTVMVEPVGTPVYTLLVRPVSVVQGDSATALLSTIRANFFDSLVTLDVEHVSAGLTASVVPTRLTKETATVMVRADADAPPGRYSLTIRGTSASRVDRVAVVPVTIRAAAASAVTLPKRHVPSYR